MSGIPEAFLHFVWKEQLFQKSGLCTIQGQKIEILDPGVHNQDEGPDFFNARIRIDGVLWFGNVEIHVRASEWIKHGHYSDPLYENVILHVVAEPDEDVTRLDGKPLPALVLQWDKMLEQNYRKLITSGSWVACQPYLHKLDPFRIKVILGRLVVERLERFVSGIDEELHRTKNNWEETFYRLLGWGYGLKINAQPFLLLARSLPLSYVLKHKNNSFQLEALFFGQAGWLEDRLFGDDYFDRLKKEYAFLRNKFSLQPLPVHLWRFMRMRPSTFPTIRLAQFVNLLHTREHLFSSVMMAENPEDLYSIFQVCASEYWDTHYLFNKPAKKQTKKMGIQAIRNLLINVVIPFYFVYGSRTEKNELKDKALNLLESLPPEQNAIIRKWASIGIRADNAFYSQALLQLKNEYCNPGRCSDCTIGKNLILNS